MLLRLVPHVALVVALVVSGIVSSPLASPADPPPKLVDFDRDVPFQGFTGRNYAFREEFTSRIWATRYDFPAIRDGRVKRDEMPDDTPSGAQGWFINIRRPKPGVLRACA